jgi:hypothetical protein
MSSADSNAGHRKLAAAMVVQAVVDWRKGPRESHRDQGRFNSAENFISGDFYPWAEIIDIDPEFVREHIGFEPDFAAPCNQGVLTYD